MQVVRLLADQNIDGVAYSTGNIVNLDDERANFLIITSRAAISTSQTFIDHYIRLRELTQRPQGLGPVVILGQDHRGNAAMTYADSVPNGTTESGALYSLLIRGGTIGANDALRVTTLWSHPSSATNKTVRVKLGSTAILNITNTTTTGMQDVRILRNRNAQNSQVTQAVGVVAAFGTFTTAASTFTLDFTADQTLTATAQWGTAGTGTNSIVLESIIVEHLRAV